MKGSRLMDGKLYLISAEILPIEWNITIEIKSIKGIKAKKATYQKDDMLVEAWFTVDIKTKCGVQEYYNLPGLILEAKHSFSSFPDQYATYKLEKIVLDNALEFKSPIKGKNITKEEFDTLYEAYKKRNQIMVEMENLILNKKSLAKRGFFNLIRCKVYCDFYPRS